jgi:hypothetical protein
LGPWYGSWVIIVGNMALGVGCDDIYPNGRGGYGWDFPVLVFGLMLGGSFCLHGMGKGGRGYCPGFGLVFGAGLALQTAR